MAGTLEPRLDGRDPLRGGSTRTQSFEAPPEAHSGAWKQLAHLDVLLLLIVFTITAFGIWTLFGIGAESAYVRSLATKQLGWAGIACVGLVVAVVLDYRWLAKIAPAAYGVNLLLLILVLVVGREVNGAKSWFRVGPVSFQPAETMKLLTVLMLAQWYAEHPKGIRHVRDLLIPGLITGVPAGLVLLQPDLGTMSLFVVIFFSLAIWGGMHKGIFFGLLGMGLGAAISLYPFLKNYQKERILTFLDPYRDRWGSGYNVIQSFITVGNGGTWGRGWGNGSQTVYRYLPEAHTDFIFASSLEQVGLVGGAGLLLLYGLLFWRILVGVEKARDRFGGLLLVGLGSILLGHVGLNMFMNLGLFPVTGLPLPLMSYGGTFLLSMYILVGLILNVGMRRFVFAG
ncbi:MAG: rod shape-determining protein RodA [Candidatus Sumerlaeia bacterium]|nr:rod shape-determining protein RodA [Candidatus Sumerlaeia bacterium]